MRLKDKVAIITGGGRGIGKAIALGYASEGADLAITGRTLEDLESVVDAVRSRGRNAVAIPADIREARMAEQVVSRTVEVLGKLDILVNNAGTVVIKPSLEVREEDWDRVLDTNLKGAFFMSQAAARPMLRESGGAIINIGSIASVVGLPGRALYCASKGGLSLLTKALAAEWAPHGIRVNCLAPGYVRTEGHDRLVAQGFIDRDRLAAAAPARRVASPEEIVGPAVFLASDDASFVHGATLLVDGGWVSDAHAPTTPWAS